jgi:transposase InsO family protein
MRSRKLTSEDVLERLSDLFVRKGVPDQRRSGNGSEFAATRVREWLERVGVETLYIERGWRWENGYVERSTASGGTSFWPARCSTACWRPRD